MMRQFSSAAVAAATLTILATLTLAPAQSLGTPVYLRPDSRFPSGHHPREWLENKTKRIQFQRWFRVSTRDKAYGWLPEDHVLTALHLVDEATLNDMTPARDEPLMDGPLKETLPSGTRVSILEIQGSWARAQVLATPTVNGSGGKSWTSKSREVWIPNEALRPDLSKATTKAFITSRSPVFVSPLAQGTRVLSHVTEASFVKVVRELDGWLEIKIRAGTGYVQKLNSVTAKELGFTKVKPLFANAPMRSAPLPFANLIQSLAITTELGILETHTLRWGQAKIRDIGLVWWPIAEIFGEAEAKSQPPETKISTSELFTRKIFDMASSPAIPELKFASAQGLFRTTDGQSWSKIGTFKDQDFPIAVAASGAVFVGPFMSDDHGETFQEWIRWDSLIATLKLSHKPTPGRLQILDIRPEDPSGRRVSVKLGFGSGAPIRLATSDQGLSWSLTNPTR